MARSSNKVASENDVTPSAEETLDFDDDNLRAIAEEYENKGNGAFRERDFTSATHFYTEAIKVNCKDEDLNAKLYVNRAIANFKSGNYLDSLNDVKAATGLQPTYLNAIVGGARACVELKQFEEAVTWCDKGLAIDKNNKKLLKLRIRSVKELNKQQKSDGEKKEKNLAAHTVKVTVNALQQEKSFGDFRKAIDNYELDLEIAKEVGDKPGEGYAYGNLGNAFLYLSNYRKAIDYYELSLKIAKEVGDKAGEGSAYGNLGVAFHNLGDFRKAIDYGELCLKIAKEVGDKADEGEAYGKLGNAFRNLGDFRKAIDYYELHLKIAKEVGDKAVEGSVNGNLGNAFCDIGDFKKAIDCHELDLKIAKEVENKVGEGRAYGNLGIAFLHRGDFRKAIDCSELHLKIVKELGDKAGEGRAYGNLGNAFCNLGDFRKAIDYYKCDLKIAKEVGDKAGEGKTYGNLGIAFRNLGDFKNAIDCYELQLKIAKEVGDKAGEGKAYGNLGNAFCNLGDFRKAIDYHECCVKMMKELGNKAGEGGAYCNIGGAFCSMGDFRKAIDYHELHLKTAKEVGDKAGEGKAYSNLGDVFCYLDNFNKAIDYYELHLKTTKEVGDKAGEGRAYGKLGAAFRKLGHFRKAIDYFELHLEIAKEVEDKNGEANAYQRLGGGFESVGFLPKALECYELSVRSFNHVRNLLQSKDEWKISYRNQVDIAYTCLWRVLLKQGKTVEALFAAEKGRAQALVDLMLSQFGLRESQSMRKEEEERCFQLKRSIPSSTVFQAFDKVKINLWVLSKDEHVQLRQKEISEARSVLDDSNLFLQSLIQTAYKQIDVPSEVICEDRSMDAVGQNVRKAAEKSDKKNSQPFVPQESCLSTLYDILIQPIADLIQGDELIIAPDGPLWLAPYAASVDADSKYLSDLFRIRLVPSLTSLRLLADCPKEYHNRRGALLVGDPWVEEVRNSNGEIVLEPLPFARKEVEMIGEILNVTPLIGKKATECEVLKELNSVALVHIAAHGRMETGEIALTPDQNRESPIPTKDDYILRMADVLSVQMRAKLVVLSCCHSGRGEIKAEGVVGIARAFMGAGARSVLVSLWAIDDDATLEFMRSFYHHLAVEGRSASESLNQAGKDLRETGKFSDVRHWAPFVLIGDDITLDFHQKK